MLLRRLRLLRVLAGPPRAVAARASLVLALALIEALGPRTASDAADLLGVAVLAMALGTWLAFDDAARGALARASRAAGAAVAARAPVFGVDLRGEPVMPRGVPALVRGIAAACAVLTALELLWILGVGTPFRAFAARGSYVVLLLANGALWAALALAIAMPAWLVAALARAVLRARHGTRPPAGRRRAILLGYLAAAVGGLVLLPEWVALLLLALAVALFALGETVLPRLPMLWRDRDGRIGALDVAQWLVAQALLVWWPVAIVVVGGLGGRAFGLPAGDTTPVTDALGSLAAWSAGPAALLVTLLELDLLRQVTRHDPAVRCATTVHVTPEGAAGGERRVRELLEARGWRVRFHPEPREPADVPLRLVDRMPPQRDRHGRWPLAVSALALETPELLRLIARRDVVQRRRLLMRGLRGMLAFAWRRSYAQGTGFWIAPQHWFAVGLTRDTADDELEVNPMIGEPYRAVIPRAALHEAYRVFSAVEIDIVFVEDGVPWRGLARVMQRLFGQCDEGLGRVEDRHMTGIPGIRVIVHDFALGEPLGRERYPEPDYEDLGRARVLHVFKDRGGEDETVPAPAADDGVPLRA